LPLAERHGEIHQWLIGQDRYHAGEPWPARWQRCQRQLQACFKEVWLVYLHHPSRRLGQGTYVFEPLTDFLRVPGAPPAVVLDAYQQAFEELPTHRFVYLDLLWEAAPEGRVLLSPERLRANVREQERQFQRQLRHDRLLIQAAQARQRGVLDELRMRHGVTESLPLPTTPAEARRVLGLSRRALEDALLTQLGRLRLTKYDPVIVFEEPALRRRAGGHLPLGLVAHWD
jgi:hypothetical protein